MIFTESPEAIRERRMKALAAVLKRISNDRSTYGNNFPLRLSNDQEFRDLHLETWLQKSDSDEIGGLVNEAFHDPNDVHHVSVIIPFIMRHVGHQQPEPPILPSPEVS